MNEMLRGFSIRNGLDRKGLEEVMEREVGMVVGVLREAKYLEKELNDELKNMLQELLTISHHL